MEKSAQEYRAHAAALRRQAARTDDPVVRQQLEIAARDYDELADELESWQVLEAR
jgi:hypothetical protein